MNTKKRQFKSSERGALIVLFGASVITLILVLALAVDLGSAYLATSNLSKAVDAGALAAARYTMKGETEMRQVANKVAVANYGSPGDPSNTTQYDITIWSPAVDTTRIRVAGATDAPAYFSRVFGWDEIPVHAIAEATRYPLDMSLVLDLSGSLERNGAFDDMQDAAKNFLEYFDDNIDQFGLVTYSTWAVEQMSIRKNFKATGQGIIDALAAITDTNIQEGLRVGKAQLDSAPNRDNAVKTLVLFTDGRPTAVADHLRMPDGNNPLWYDGVVAGYISGSSYRGLFQSNDGLKIRFFNSGGVPTLVANSSTASSVQPKVLPNATTVNGDNIRTLAVQRSEEWASQIRAAGYTIFAIGLGNPDAEFEGDSPDLDFLRRIANEDGVSNADQPKGEMMFAPTVGDLNNAFATLADRVITRLTR